MTAADRTSPYLRSLDNFNGFSEEEMEELRELRILRHNLLHGYNAITAEELKPYFDRLLSFSSMSIARLPNGGLKEKLGKKLGELADPMV